MIGIQQAQHEVFPPAGMPEEPGKRVLVWTGSLPELLIAQASKVQVIDRGAYRVVLFEKELYCVHTSPFLWRCFLSPCAFLDLDDLIGHQPMGLAMHSYSGIFARSLAEAKNCASAFIPVPQVLDPVLLLNGEIAGGSTSSRFSRQPFHVTVNVHVECHNVRPPLRLLLPYCRKPVCTKLRKTTGVDRKRHRS